MIHVFYVCLEPVTSPPTLPLSVHEQVRCTCSMQGTGFSCPSGVGGHPPLIKMVTGDILVDITGRNVSEYLLFTSDRLRLHRQERKSLKDKKQKLAGFQCIFIINVTEILYHLSSKVIVFDKFTMKNIDTTLQCPSCFDSAFTTHFGQDLLFICIWHKTVWTLKMIFIKMLSA